MSHSGMRQATRAALVAMVSFSATASGADARVHHRRNRAASVTETQQQATPRQGVVGYFGPGAYGPPCLFGPYFGNGWYGAPRGDLGFALLGALNGGGLRGFVECSNYYARFPGACGF